MAVCFFFEEEVFFEEEAAAGACCDCDAAQISKSKGSTPSSDLGAEAAPERPEGAAREARDEGGAADWAFALE